jgi:hypothetical protein
MFDVRRYLSMESWSGLITMISDRTYLNLVPETCTLAKLENLGGLNTRVTINTNRSTSAAQLMPPLPKVLEYTYTRLDPNVFFRTATTQLKVDGLRLPTNTQAILTRLGAVTGIAFDIDDFEEKEFTSYGVVSLISKPESLYWAGTLNLTLVSSLQRPLASVLTSKSSVDVFKPLGQTGRVADFVYMANHDFTPFRYEMLALINAPNSLAGERLCQILRKMTGNDWVFQDAPAAYNICVDNRLGELEFDVLYSGPPITPYTLRTDKRKLVVLRLDKTRCTALTGNLLLHYD